MKSIHAQRQAPSEPAKAQTQGTLQWRVQLVHAELSTWPYTTKCVSFI